MKESLIKRKIHSYLNSIGKSIPYPGSEYGEVGTPDIIACVRRHMIVIEVKKPGKKPRKIQQVRLMEWERAGAIALSVTTLEEVQKACRILSLSPEQRGLLGTTFHSSILDKDAR